MDDHILEIAGLGPCFMKKLLKSDFQCWIMILKSIINLYNSGLFRISYEELACWSSDWIDLWTSKYTFMFTHRFITWEVFHEIQAETLLRMKFIFSGVKLNLGFHPAIFSPLFRFVKQSQFSNQTFTSGVNIFLNNYFIQIFCFAKMGFLKNVKCISKDGGSGPIVCFL